MIRLNTSVRRVRQAVLYDLWMNVASIPCDASGTPRISSFTATLYKTVGNSAPVMCSATLQFKRCTSSSCTTWVVDKNVAGITVPTAVGYETYVVQALIDNKVVSEKHLMTTLDGGIGGKGAKQRITAWQRDTEYLQGSDGEDWYDIVWHNDQRYLCMISHTSTSKTPQESVADSEGFWMLETRMEFVATRLLLSERIKADQIDVDDVRAEMIESKKIQADEIDVDNLSVKKLDGAVGSFKTLQCINSAGDVVGSISFDPNGSMWFSGDLYHQGVKDGRALRFYAANLNVRGSLGARQMNTVVVVGSQARYYPNGYGTYDEYTIINLTASKNTAGETYYTIPLYSPTGMEGISFNNVLLASTSTSTFRYVLLATAGCNVTVVNTNDNGVDNTRIVYANGKPHSIQGGSCADLICVRPEDMIPTPASNILGRGWLYRGYFDNDWR